jgi:hypothetical protein
VADTIKKKSPANVQTFMPTGSILIFFRAKNFNYFPSDRTCQERMSLVHLSDASLWVTTHKLIIILCLIMDAIVFGRIPPIGWNVGGKKRNTLGLIYFLKWQKNALFSGTVRHFPPFLVASVTNAVTSLIIG